jgi:CRISPR/Cas system-associated protein Cas5 (RAMP superfamily)
MSSESTGTTASPLPHPDLNQEVATLSNKLINAINYQTNLDDTLSQTRHELEASKNRIKVLEHEAEQHARLIASGSLVSFDQVQVERKKLLSSLAEESGKRATIEREKAEIEKELENLTTALFEEANKVSLHPPLQTYMR